MKWSNASNSSMKWRDSVVPTNKQWFWICAADARHVKRINQMNLFCNASKRSQTMNQISQCNRSDWTMTRSISTGRWRRSSDTFLTWIGPRKCTRCTLFKRHIRFIWLNFKILLAKPLISLSILRIWSTHIKNPLKIVVDCNVQQQRWLYSGIPTQSQTNKTIGF